MSSLYWKLATTPNYVRRFGLASGIRLHSQIERNLEKRSNRTRQFRVPGYHAPITLRDTVSDHAIFWQCIVQAQYDLYRFKQGERLRDSYLKCVNNGHSPLIIDGGGNIGLAAIYLATLFPSARVCTIEPEVENFAVLEQNIAPFGSRITAVRGALWNGHNAVSIKNPGISGATVRVGAPDDGSVGAIRTYSIPDICELAGVTSPFIVKLDIEGSQKQLFKSNTRWLEECHLVMIELDDWVMPWQGTSQSFFSAISRYPFEYLMQGETLFCFHDLSDDA